MHYMLLKKKLGWFMKAVDLVVFLISVALVVVCFGENLISIIFRSFCVCCFCVQERLVYQPLSNSLCRNVWRGRQVLWRHCIPKEGGGG